MRIRFAGKESFDVTKMETFPRLLCTLDIIKNVNTENLPSFCIMNLAPGSKHFIFIFIICKCQARKVIFHSAAASCVGGVGRGGGQEGGGRKEGGGKQAEGRVGSGRRDDGEEKRAGRGKGGVRREEGR